MPENLADLQREIAELNERADALRATLGMDRDDAAGTAEAALAELAYAGTLLRDCGERLAADAAAGGGPRRAPSGDDEKAVLRAVFNELTVPVLLLDHEGYIRRINTLAAERLGSAPGYLTGKPFSNFVDLRRRAPMRSWLAAVLRGGETASFGSRLAQRGWAEDVHLTLTRLDVPTEANPLVLVVVSPAPDGGGDEGPAPLEPEVEDQVVVLAARRLDVLTRMTRLLLASAGPGGAGRPLALDEAAELLADSYADWVLVDVCDLPGDPARARRAVVAAPEADGHRELLEGRDPGAAEVPGQVLATGTSVLDQQIEDETALGSADDGAPLLSLLGAGSLLSVPLVGSRGVRGALTLIRRSNRGAFRLADLGLIEEIGEHIGLALPPRPQA
ncbi:PAS domain-containing protein [Nocardiopsis sp. RSe5-2]|uniref:PAS domain-containing protein n=1 Tax=Nocardiopsis endophytica TaxID=3018445 RepID=A0ABT4UCL0_9ACTN|nr:PAS domain-containing protein [Nocardiopsis endophytica]MDA2814706.1 PAS domain-containing protein [Nocardiopsis endophytica]